MSQSYIARRCQASSITLILTSTNPEHPVTALPDRPFAAAESVHLVAVSMQDVQREWSWEGLLASSRRHRPCQHSRLNGRIRVPISIFAVKLIPWQIGIQLTQRVVWLKRMPETPPKATTSVLPQARYSVLRSSPVVVLQTVHEGKHASRTSV